MNLCVCVGGSAGVWECRCACCLHDFHGLADSRLTLTSYSPRHLPLRSDLTSCLPSLILCPLFLSSSSLISSSFSSFSRLQT